MKKFRFLALAVVITSVGCGSSSKVSTTTTTTRTLTSLTSSTGTTITATFPAPATNQVGSSACNSDYTSGGTNCTYTSESCGQVTETTTSCQSARTALGLSGNWLKFSCNVTLGLAYYSGGSYISTTNTALGTYVSMTTNDFPTYTSNYYSSSGTYSFTANSQTVTGNFSSLYSAFSTPFPDPGTMASPSTTITMYVPISPTQCTGGTCNSGSSSSNAMAMGAVGMAINGVYIYSSMAAGTDNIFAEAGSFDQCQGHPAGSQYHYHNEPPAISSSDDNLIGVMMDGFWVYGRKDSDGSIPGSVVNYEAGGNSNANLIYWFGGHTGTLPNNSSTSQFHYHATEWIGCYDSGANQLAGYYYTDNGTTWDTFNSSTFSATPGAPNIGTTNLYCKGSWIDAWFLTGHGNGGVFQTPSSIGTGGGVGAVGSPVWTTFTGVLTTSYNSAAASPSAANCGGVVTGVGCFSQNTAGVRYYYGNPGSCPNCNSDNTVQ